MNTEPTKKYHVILTENQLELLQQAVTAEIAEIRKGLADPRPLSRVLRRFFDDQLTRFQILEDRLDPRRACRQLPPSALCAHANELLQELKYIVHGCSLSNLSQEDHNRIRRTIRLAEGQQ